MLYDLNKNTEVIIDNLVGKTEAITIHRVVKQGSFAKVIC